MGPVGRPGDPGSVAWPVLEFSRQAAVPHGVAFSFSIPVSRNRDIQAAPLLGHSVLNYSCAWFTGLPGVETVTLIESGLSHKDL